MTTKAEARFEEFKAMFPQFGKGNDTFERLAAEAKGNTKAGEEVKSKKK